MLTKKDIRDMQDSVRGLATELQKFAANYSKVPILQTKSALVTKYDLIRGYMAQISKQRIDFLNLNNNAMVYLCTQKINIFVKLTEIFSQPRLGKSDINEIASLASSLSTLTLLEDVEARIATLNIAA